MRSRDGTTEVADEAAWSGPLRNISLSVRASGLPPA